jgi:hypothetical protein
MDFTITEYEKFLDTVSDSTLQLTFMEMSLVKSCVLLKKNSDRILKSY